MKLTVRSAEEFFAYQINDENDLDQFLTENCEDCLSISKKGPMVKVNRQNGDSFKFLFGDWLVVFTNEVTKSYTNDKFIQSFKVVG